MAHCDDSPVKKKLQKRKKKMNQLNAASTYSRLELKNTSIDSFQTLGK